MTVSLTPTDGS